MKDIFKDDNDPVNRQFKLWFENSKTIDDNNEPLILYHGTHSQFNVFDINYTNAENYYGKGFYFTSNINDAHDNYEASSSPDRQSRVSKIYEFIREVITKEEMEDLKNSEDFESSNYVSIPELLYELKLLQEENFEYHLIMQKVQNYFDDKILIVDSMDDLNMDLAQQIHDILFNANSSEDNRTIEAYVKMVNPFDTRTAHIISENEISGDFKDFLDRFILLNSNYPKIEEFKEHINQQIGYCIQDYDRDFFTGTIYKNSLFELFNIEENDGEHDYEYAIFDKFFLENFIEYFEEENGDYIQIEFKDISFISKFKSFLTETKNIAESDLEELFSSLNTLLLDHCELDFKTFEETCKQSDVFINYSDNELTSYGQCFSEFIQTLGYDGIIMSAEQFKNMNHTFDTCHYIVFNPNNIKLADGTNVEYSLDNNDIRYKTILFKPDVSISKEIALEKIKLFHKEFPLLSETKLFKTQEEARKYTNTKCQGFYYSNKNEETVGIILENIKDTEELEKTLIHEHMGHSNLKKVLGKNYDPTMLGMYNYFTRKNVFKKEDISKKEKIIKAEERFAQSIETNDQYKPTLISRITSAITSKVRKVFPTFPVFSFDVENLSYQSFQKAKKKKTQP